MSVSVKINPNKTINATSMATILDQCTIEEGILKIPKELLEGWDGMEYAAANLFQNSDVAARSMLIAFGFKHGISKAQVKV
jgi:hypothetical protein